MSYDSKALQKIIILNLKFRSLDKLSMVTKGKKIDTFSDRFRKVCSGKVFSKLHFYFNVPGSCCNRIKRRGRGRLEYRCSRHHSQLTQYPRQHPFHEPGCYRDQKVRDSPFPAVSSQLPQEVTWLTTNSTNSAPSFLISQVLSSSQRHLLPKFPILCLGVSPG